MSLDSNVVERDLLTTDVVENPVDIADQFGQLDTPTVGEVKEGPVSAKDFNDSIPEYINPTPKQLDEATGVIDSLVEARNEEILETAEQVEKKSIFGRLLEKGSLIFGKSEMLDTSEKQTLLGTIQEHTPLFKDCKNWKQAYGWWVKNFPKMYGQFVASEVYVAGVVLTFAPHVIPLGRTVVAPILLHLGYKHSEFIRKTIDPKVHALVQKYKYSENKTKK